MKEKSYNRGIRAHKLYLEVFFRLMWKAFLAWYESQEKRIPEEPVLRKIVDCVRMVENKENARDSVRKMEADLMELMSLFGVFKSKNQARSKLFTFWDEYGTVVTSLLQFLKAERTGNWKLHLSSITAMLPHYAAMDRQNYAATGTNTPRCVQRVCCWESLHKSFRAALFTSFSQHGPGAVDQHQL